MHDQYDCGDETHASDPCYSIDDPYASYLPWTNGLSEASARQSPLHSTPHIS